MPCAPAVSLHTSLCSAAWHSLEHMARLTPGARGAGWLAPADPLWRPRVAMLAAVSLASCCAFAGTLACSQQCLQAICIANPPLRMRTCPVYCSSNTYTEHLLGSCCVAVLANGALAGSGSDKRRVCSAYRGSFRLLSP
jgi:hypothetical protein